MPSGNMICIFYRFLSVHMVLAIRNNLAVRKASAFSIGEQLLNNESL